MTTRPIYCLILASLMLACPALGRIGETVDQCSARYGNPIRIDPATGFHSYQRGGMDIICKFTEGKCALIVFTHSQRDALGHGTALTADEIDALLVANSAGKAWNKRLTAPGQSWSLSDGSALAQYDVGKHVLAIITTAENSQDAARSAEASRQRLKGF